MDISVPEIQQDMAEGELALGVRPEDIRFSDASSLRGAVYGSEYHGTNQIVAVEMAKGLVKARVPADQSFRIGETVGLELNYDKTGTLRLQVGQGRCVIPLCGASSWLKSS